MNSLHRKAIAASLLALLWLAGSVLPALAHTGHAHADEGLGVTTVLSVAGVVIALGISLVLVNRFARPGEIVDEEHDRTST